MKKSDIQSGPILPAEGESEILPAAIVPSDEIKPGGFALRVAAACATSDELSELRFADAEIQRLRAVFDSYSPAVKLAEFRAAQELSVKNPTPENERKFRAMNDPRDLEEARLNKRSAKSAQEAAWLHFGKAAEAILKRILGRAHAMWLEAKQDQAEREKQWLATWEEWCQWSRFYSAALPPKPLGTSENLAEMALFLHGTIVSFDPTKLALPRGLAKGGDEMEWVRGVGEMKKKELFGGAFPSIENVLRIVGLTLERGSND